jgi:hypothetical protein
LSLVLDFDYMSLCYTFPQREYIPFHEWIQIEKNLFLHT